LEGGGTKCRGLMMSIRYNSELAQRARELRINATKQENHLWYDFLRNYRPRFTRQRIVGNYILDFYCADAKLAVELDGSQHYEENNKKYDCIRTQFLHTMNIKVIRFSNLEVDEKFEGVCKAIDKEIVYLLNNPRLYEAPPSNEGG